MNEFMKTLLSLSVSGTLLLLLILGLKQLYKNKFSRRWQYYIWIIVALCFLLPFTPNTTIVGILFEKFDTTAITNDITTSSNAPVFVNTDNRESEPIQTNKDTTVIAMRKPFDKDEQAWERLDTIMEQMKAAEGMTEELKAKG